MKRSRTIQLTLVASAAAVLAGCSEKPSRHCVDANNRVVDDKYCGGNGGVPGHTGGFVWYYGGPRGYIPFGTPMTGGSLSPQAAPSAGAGTTRGVVGGSGEAASGGAHGSGGSGSGGGGGE